MGDYFEKIFTVVLISFGVIFYCFLTVSIFDVCGRLETSERNVKAEIMDTEHYITTFWGRHHTYEVIVMVNGKIYEINDRDTYYLYCNKEGQTFPATLVTSYFLGAEFSTHPELYSDYGVSWQEKADYIKTEKRKVGSKNGRNQNERGHFSSGEKKSKRLGNYWNQESTVQG